MDLLTVFGIAACAISLFLFIKQLIRFIKFVISCSREGVRAIKFRLNLSSVIIIAMTIAFVVFVGFWFGKAAQMNKDVKLIEENGGIEYAEIFAEREAQERGIIILDPVKYYIETIENAKATARSYTWLGIGFLMLSTDGIMSIIGLFFVITSKGFRISTLKDAIPIFAEYDRKKGMIIVKANDITGNPEKLFTAAANPRNLASLGQFIVWEDEQTIQEETL